MELIGEEEPTPVVVTSKNWYRMLLKTCKELDNLIYWTASPVENCALKALPVQQQAQLFRVMLEHWLTKCHPEVDEAEESSDSESYRFQLLGYDDKGDCYWRFSTRLYREEMPPSLPPAEPIPSAIESEEPQRGVRQKHKRERLAVTESANYLRRTLLEPTTRSTRNSAGRFANDLFLEEERIAGRNEKLRQESLETFEDRTGLPLRWLGKSDHMTTLALDQSSTEALLFILKAGTSERMRELVLSIENSMLPSVKSENGNGKIDSKARKSKMVEAKNKKNMVKEEEVEDKEQEEAMNGEMDMASEMEHNGSGRSSTPTSTKKNGRKARSQTPNASGESSHRSSREGSPGPEVNTTATTATGSTELPIEPNNDSEESSNDMDILEVENVKEEEEDVIEESKIEKIPAEVGAASTDALVPPVDISPAMAVDSSTVLSDAEDSAITALMGAVESSEPMLAGSSASLLLIKEDDVSSKPQDTSIRSNASSSPDTSLMLDAPRQKRQAAVKSRQMLSNGLHQGAAMDDALFRQERKRTRNSVADELTLRLRITPQMRRSLRAEMEDEEPLKKKMFRAPSPPRRGRPAEPSLANLEEEALSVLTTPNPLASNGAAGMNLAALAAPSLAGIPLTSNAGFPSFSAPLMSPFSAAALYGSPYLQAFSQLGGMAVDPMALLAGYNPLLAGNPGLTQDWLLQQQRQQLYQQQLLEAHFLQQQQLLLQQQRALAQQHPGGLQLDPTRITIPVAMNGAASPTATLNAANFTVSVPIHAEIQNGALPTVEEPTSTPEATNTSNNPNTSASTDSVNSTTADQAPDASIAPSAGNDSATAAASTLPFMPSI